MLLRQIIASDLGDKLFQENKRMPAMTLDSKDFLKVSDLTMKILFHCLVRFIGDFLSYFSSYKSMQNAKRLPCLCQSEMERGSVKIRNGLGCVQMEW